VRLAVSSRVSGGIRSSRFQSSFAKVVSVALA
jgi:hypothetical protein